MTLLFINAVATLYMTGVIWFVQVVHYPLFDGVGQDVCRPYFQRHARLTGYVVVGPMLVELVSAILLVAWRPEVVPLVAVAGGLLLVVLIWVSTFLLQVPCHRRLADGYSASTISHLVRTNWIRTILWSARGVLVIWMLAAAIQG